MEQLYRKTTAAETVNRITLCGYAASAPVLSHENHGRKFYRFLLECPRLSGVCDTLPVLADAEILDGVLPDGDTIAVTGQLRSYNAVTETGRHLILSVFAETAEAGAWAPQNSVRLCGTLCKPPIFRRTPLGREICDGMLAVRRQYGRTDYLPCIFWGSAARTVGSYMTGDTVRLDGRMQSRAYRKVLPDGSAERRTAYEVSALTILSE